MSANPTLPVQYGTIGGDPIIGDVNSATLADLVLYTMPNSGETYYRSTPPGYPIPAAGQSVATSLTDSPSEIAPNTQVYLYSDEADAITAWYNS